MRHEGLIQDDVAAKLKLTPREFQDFLRGQIPVPPELATALAAHLGASSSFWLARDAQYWEDLERVQADEWSARLPLKQMSALGWIREPTNWRERTSACLDFFAVSTVTEWDETYAAQVEDALYRTSATYELATHATAVWFRACELGADALDVGGTYSEIGFRSVLKSIRVLTRQPEPSEFIPALVAQCGEAGVRVVVVPAPKGCPASGATRLHEGLPLISLSARHLSDDHFWFSFFHEAGHVLSHDLSAPFIDFGQAEDSRELEANEFAAYSLLGSDPLEADLSSPRRIIESAHRRGISPGILVGQMQHKGLLRRSAHNGLKRRYVWDGANLERARRR